jgi:hypothetical protein
MFCPICNSTNLYAGRRATDDVRVYALVHCTDCDTVFDAYAHFGQGTALVPHHNVTEFRQRLPKAA